MFNKIKSKFKDEAFLRGFICLIGAILTIAVSWLAVIPLSADEGVTPRAVPTNLTGVTVFVPSGWSASAGYGRFTVSGTLTNYSWNFTDIYVGYEDTPSSDTASNYITFRPYFTLDSDNELVFYFDGTGDVSNSSLIQWFVDNDATFTVPQPETSSIAGGVYHFKTFGNLPDIPDPPFTNPEGFTYSYNVHGKLITTSRTIPFTFLDLTFDEYVSNSHYTITFSFTTNDGVIDIATYSASYGQIQLEVRPDFKYLVFDEEFLDSYGDIEFIRQFLVSGLPDTHTSPTDNPWAYILEMIIEALKVDLFGYFSVWDIFTTICGIFIVTWLLKLLAGG